MTQPEFEQILRGTLEDYRVSRGERRVLRQILNELNADQRQLDLLRHQAFDVARTEIMSPTAHGVIDWLEDIVKVLNLDSSTETKRAQAWFSPGDECVRAICAELNRARRSTDICVFTITDNRISDTIVDCHRRGVGVRIITDDDKSEDRGSDIDRLEKSGIAVRVDHSPYHMHHKFALFDDETLLTGSYNWTRSAAESNEENVVVTDEQALVKQFSRQFEQLWDAMKT
ncbi:MAG: phospholipase D-like domain-containing protein [Pirellulales bacterium]|nr:phospholipase D-like domain-containing protein [Pirellulales bacterium]